MSMSGAWVMAKIIALTIIAVAGLIAGLRIFQNMQKGEEFEGPIIRWGAGLVGASALVYAVEAFIYTDSAGWASSGTAPHLVAISYGAEAHQAALYLGILFSIIGLIRIYKKVRDGDDDVYDYGLKWFGSLMFLFMMGWIIDSILN
ncbi:DUF4134 domain-containing protein [Dyadobacter flavalbus]|jgi:hypothetical protein|uniref:DUF4134 domain-containing protein n=2 Tax=Spirosomataceae TaxID=2896860 RepID=A0A5M8QY12_9BACT|nr:DUF4134 domain-containing protein [Dyadobacter flavalbus]